MNEILEEALKRVKEHMGKRLNKLQKDRLRFALERFARACNPAPNITEAERKDLIVDVFSPVLELARHYAHECE